MLRLLAAASLLFAACDSPRRVEPKDAPESDSFVYVPPPPPPATVDAGPPSAVSCSEQAPTCDLPPSTCLDPHYVLYYTAAMCVGDMCQYTWEMTYCASGCINGGCQGGFT